jgi:hypothetical protein
MTPTQPAATPTERALTAEEECRWIGVYGWLNDDPSGKPCNLPVWHEGRHENRPADAERAARALEGGEEMPPDVSNLPPLDIYARGYQHGAEAARFDASLRAARAEPGLRAEVARLRDVVGFVADWAHDCSPTHDPDAWSTGMAGAGKAPADRYGFDSIEERCRAALEAHGEPGTGR